MRSSYPFISTGQFFFDNATLEAVAVVEEYAANSISWADGVTNDGTYPTEFAMAWTNIPFSADMWYPYRTFSDASVFVIPF